jgi:serine/threonine protein kinase/Flp pilus assembly protein TadD
MPDPPDRLKTALADRYAIERELGSGGMATVYLAQDLKHDRQVALKVLKPELAHAVGADRFLREIRITAGLNHPHILPLLDSGEADGFLYFVMPYVAGESLRARLDREGPLPIDEALRIAEQVASALEHAHRQEVIHRDIKPENILLHEGEAMVADFGIAVAVSVAGGERLTETGIAVGTPAFMSPEQASGDERVDERSDIYSLGCVLYEMVGGEPPHKGSTPREILAQKVLSEARSIRELRPEADAALEAVLARALEAAPEDRFATAGELGEALRSPEVGWTLAAKRLKAKRRKVAAAAAAGLLVVLVGAGAVWHWVRGEAEVPKLVVLPFEVFGVPEDDNVLGAVSEEIRSRFGPLSAVRVIASLSARQAKESGWTVSEIGERLDVAWILAGTVRQQDREGHVSVTAELIRVEDASSVWNDSYDALGLEELVQAEIDVARSIAEALEPGLTGSEAEVLERRYTQDPEAYRLYQRGRQYLRRPGYLRQDLESAQQLIERALELDPEFALAYAALSEVHGRMHWWYDPSAARVAQQRKTLEAALRIDPELPEAHNATGLWHYMGERDYERALTEFEFAARRRPNDPWIWMQIAAVQRRLGNWDGVLVAFEKATGLDPLDADLLNDMGGTTYLFLHRHAEALSAYDRALALAPDLHEVHFNKGFTYLLWQGQLDSLRSGLDRMPTGANTVPWGTRTGAHVYLLYLDRQADSLLNRLLTAQVPVFESYNWFRPSPLYAAWAHRLRGDRPAARAAFDSALVLVDSVVAELPDDWRVHAARGLALAGLGRREGALRETRWLEESEIYRHDALLFPRLAESRAWILAQAGEAEAALDELERLLERPTWVTVPILRVDPSWDPIREHPRFKALLARYGGP